MKHRKSFPVELISSSKLSNIDFNNLKFGRDFSDHMLLAEYANGEWESVKIIPFQDINFSPAASVFHYGQAIFEGLKAHKTKDGEVLLFRPEENWKRMNLSAQRMCMAEIPSEIFLDGILQLIDLDRNWVPEGEGKSLYVRPFLIADDAFLGVKASERYKFMVITSPASNYYSGAVSVKVETKFSRAAAGGVGAAKAAGNYAASLFPAQKAQKAGYDQLIWTDSKEHKYLEESGTMNLMFVRGNSIVTPSLDSSTILPGITRKSILHLAKEWAYQVEERQIEVAELIDGLKDGSIEEVFGVGTAATIAPIANIGYEDTDYKLSDFTNWKFASKAKNYFEDLKRGEIEDQFNWTVKV
ncbi:MAG: branched-chain amino acid aminotransferase [Flavobacteriales bacterium]|nr:branched-chain amino acid aminotransferase [Flavobacteriales bacterium]